MPTTMPPLVLASASPRRSALLAAHGVAFEVVAPALDEPAEKPPAVTPSAWAIAVAHFKARAVRAQLAAADDPRAAWRILAADTIVACGDSILGKPADATNALRMLEMQARQPSDVITGVCLLDALPEAAATRAARAAGGSAAYDPTPPLLFADVTRVWMRDDAPLRAAYVAGEDWRGKAGGYGIQDVGDRLVERIEGSFNNVVGLPVERVLPLLAPAAR